MKSRWMVRSRYWSFALLAVVLSPAPLQVTCDRSGNANLATLEVEAAGLDRLVGFSAAVTTYDLWTTAGVDTIVVRTTAVVPSARVSYRLPIGGSITSGFIGIGGGEVILTIPPDTPINLVLDVTDGGTRKTYTIDINPTCSAGECDDANSCTNDACVGSTCSFTNGPDGIACDYPTRPGANDGFCSSGVCTIVVQTCNAEQTGSDTTPQSAVVSVGCTTNPTSAQSPLPFTLIVDAPVAIIAGTPFSVTLDGVGIFPEFILDAAQAAVCGGTRVVEFVDFTSTVQVRSGATGADVALGIDLGTLSPGPTQFCNFPADQTCTVNGDCLGGVCEAAILLQDLPVLDGTPNSPGGCDADTSNCPIPGPPTDCDCTACDALGPPKDAQCSDNGFCQNGSLVLQMQSAVGNYVADATGPVLWGWSDQGVPGLSVCPTGSDCGALPGRVDGCYQLPRSSFASPTPPIGIRVKAGGLATHIQCAMGEDGGTCSTTATQGCLTDADCPGAEICIGVGLDDDVICPTPDAALIRCLTY